MEQEKVNMFVMQHSKQFAPQDIMMVRQQLENMSDNQFMHIAAIDFKSPTTTLILAWFLGGFGVDAFYAKKTGFGIAKLLVWLVYVIFYAIYAATFEDGYAVVMGIVAIVMFVLFIVSIVNARKWTQQYNFNKFMQTARFI